MNKPSEVRALDAFRHALGEHPVVSNAADRWGGLSVCEWRFPWLDGFDLSANDDFVVAHHTAGSRRVRASTDGPWSETTSVPGLISVIPPGQSVSYIVDGDVAFSTLHVPSRLVRGLWRDGLMERQGFRFAFADPFVTSCMSILLNEARAPRTCNFPYVHSVTRAMLLHLMQAAEREYAVPATPQDTARSSVVALDHILDQIEVHLAEDLSLEWLAELAGVSRAHFARCFRTHMGLSPHRYVLLRRVERAKKLLTHTEFELAQIALDAGFSNQSHFTTVFRMVTGQTPSQYRRTAGGTLAGSNRSAHRTHG